MNDIQRTSERLRIAIQKSGRLSEESISLLKQAGLSLDLRKQKLYVKCENYPIDLMLLRDDDIPECVSDGVCDLGIVGENIIIEKLSSRGETQIQSVETLKQLNYGRCRLSIAVPNNSSITTLEALRGKRIATSYPASLQRFLNQNDISADIVEISGSVEIAPTLEIADAVCDLVSTGMTLQSHGLREFKTILKSQAVLIKSKAMLSPSQVEALDRLLKRLDGVLKAKQTKYIMMNAKRADLPKIKNILPGMEQPSIMPLSEDGERIAIHSVCRENIFWETMEELKSAGASSILVMPIEKIID